MTERGNNKVIKVIGMVQRIGTGLLTFSHADDGREIPFYALLVADMAAHGAGSVPDGVMCGVEGGDPKGVGALTTRNRYSRKEHRQKDTSHPRGYSYPFSIIRVL